MVCFDWIIQKEKRLSYEKKNILKTLFLSTLAVFTLTYTLPLTAHADNIPNTFEFDVISDTHISINKPENSKRFKKVLNSIANTYGTNDECIVINGDVVDYASDANYAKLSSILWGTGNGDNINEDDEAKEEHDFFSENLPYVYFNIGNHEYVYNAEPWTPGTHDDCLNYFNNAVNSIQNNVVTAKSWITTEPRYNSFDLQYINSKNSRLVFLGSDYYAGSSKAELSYNQLNWFGQVIRDNSYQGAEPMFVFLHQPIENTVYGSTIEDWGYLDKNQSTHVKSMLEGHPEIITFTSHNHHPFKSEPGLSYHYSKYIDGKMDCNIFGTPSVTGYDLGGADGINYTYPEGYHVSVNRCRRKITVEGVQYRGSYCKTINKTDITY